MKSGQTVKFRGEKTGVGVDKEALTLWAGYRGREAQYYDCALCIYQSTTH